MTVGYSAQQIRDAEAPHLEAGEPLMQRAAAGLAAVIVSALDARTQDGMPGRVLLLVGSGSNGGDALLAGAALADAGTVVEIVQTSSRVHEDGLEAATGAGAVVIQGGEPEGDSDGFDLDDVVRAAQNADVIVDAIVGTGASGPLRARARIVVTAIRPTLTADGGATVVACDIPSGIGVDDGSLPDDVVMPADLTVTFGGYKAGLLLEPAASVAGDIRLVDVGIADDLAGMTPLVST